MLDLSSDEEDPNIPHKVTKSTFAQISNKLIDINVVDQMTKKKETFKCEKNLLCEKMKFFDLYNKEALKTNKGS